MDYRRRGRPTFYFEARTETGRKQLSTGTPNRALAVRIESMWEELATSHRAWDVLGEVMSGRVPIGRLYDYWAVGKGELATVRRRLTDVDLSTLVEEWHAVHARAVRLDSANHALTHVRYLFPTGTRVLASEVTPEWLTARLYECKGKRNTLRKIHSSLSVFLDYCVRPKGIFGTNPMLSVKRTPVERSPTRYYELDVVERIVAAQPDNARKAFFATLYGAAIEVSVALSLTRADFDPSTREVRAAGTKAHTRDRICRVADWAWPAVWEHARNVLPHAPVFPGTWDRWTVSDWHRQTTGRGVRDTHGAIVQKGLDLPVKLPMHCARDHWAVRAARAGTPIQVIQAQLGHASPMLTLTKYGRFTPSAADREHWEAAATDREARRRAAR